MKGRKYYRNWMSPHFILGLFFIGLIFIFTSCGGDSGDTVENPENPTETNNKPSAVLTADSLTGNVPLTVVFDATGSSDPDGDSLTFEWDFGDGTHESGQGNRTHTYTTAGNFMANLTVSDGNGESDSAGLEITVNSIMVSVPDVAGLSRADGETAITSAGLLVGTVTSENHATVAAGDIISQNPAAGSSVAQGSPVDFVVSLGPLVVVMVNVPNVVGQTQANGETAITSDGLLVGTVTTENHATVAAGNIISQSPIAGSSVVQGSSVDFVVSLGPVMVNVPNVVGQTQANGETAITSAGFLVGTVTSENHATVTAGNIISQNPAAGSSVAQGSAVNFVVSIGPVMVTVPDVMGLPQADAETAITSAGLIVGNITQESSATVDAGNVISQDPAAGGSAAQNSAVDLTISTGAASETVPNITGRTQSEAESLILSAGYTVGDITTAQSDTAAYGVVISQTPAGGTAATSGSAVDFVVSLGSETSLPPDPATVAPELDLSVPTNMAESVKFLYTGTNPVQVGMVPDTIEEKRTAVLRGKVSARDGNPLPGIKISVLNHPEYGRTVSRTDGMFDMVVNGGGLVTLTYEKSGYLTSQRQVETPWQDYIRLPEVVMVPLDTAVSTIDFSEPMQVARGSEVSDDDGARRATLLCPQGTTAEMVMPDGSTQTLSTLNIRATEYTVGDSGPAAMPAMLPPTSAYTYCVDLTVDEAIAAGAGTVTFSRPLFYYVENFLGFDVGGGVPFGYYDIQNSQWVASKDGRVIEIMDISVDGIAALDIDGDGFADDTAALSTLDIDENEQRELASLYATGQTLWRVPIAHFSPCDANWPYRFPDGAGPPDGDPPERRRRRNNNPCREEGRCTIEYQNQFLREQVPIAGTSYTLNYGSARVGGFKAGYTLDISLSGDEIPASLRSIELEIYVAGVKAVSETFAPSTNLQYRYIWDGVDVYGRVLQGEQPVTVRIGFTYEAIYGYPFSDDGPSFGLSSRDFDDYTMNDSRSEQTLWKTYETSLGILQVVGQGLGGWTINVHHTYDPISQTLYMGDGSLESAELEKPAISVEIMNAPRAVTALPDGSLYIIDNDQLKHIDSEGNITIIAGTTSGFSGDGGPALDAKFYRPNGLDIHSDGSIYIADTMNHRVRKIDPDGNISTVAGNGETGRSGDGGPATEAAIAYPSGIVMAPGGGFYISQGRYESNEGIRYVTPEGTITTIAGQNGVWGVPGDEGPATDAYLLPRALDMGPDGCLYVLDMGYRIRKITPDGIIHTVAGTGVYGFSGDGGPAELARIACAADNAAIHVEQDGSIYFTDIMNHRIRWISPDGVINTIAGKGGDGYPVDGYAATNTNLSFGDSGGLSVDPSGNVHFTMNGRRCTVKNAVISAPVGYIYQPSRDGHEIYLFDCFYRHLKTVDALTGSLRLEFGYDASGYLVSIADGFGNITSIERDTDGSPTAIVGPFGHRTQLSLNGNGYIESAIDPLGGSWEMDYSDGGLLTGFTDPNSVMLIYTYDEDGLLIRDDDPESGFLALDWYDIDYGFEVPALTAEDRTTTYSVETLDGGTVRRTTTFPEGTRNILETTIDGTSTFLSADGMERVSQTIPDPRFGMSAPIITPYTETTPGGIALEYSQSKSATLNAEQDLLLPESIRNYQSINGLSQSVIYSKSNAGITLTTPENRQAVSILNNHGQPAEYRYAGLAPIYRSYDAYGRANQISQDDGDTARTYTITYDDSGNLDQIVNPAGLAFDFSVDLLGRITSITRPEGDQVQLGYDGRGNLTTVTTPKGAVHAFTYNHVNNITSYDPPDVTGSTAPWTLTYNLDRQLTSVIKAGDRTVEFTYDSAGRLESTVLERGTISYQYDADTGKLSSVTAPDGGYALEYDGKLVTGMIWSGEVAGTVDQTYDNFFRVSSRSVNGGAGIDLAYDNDGLLTQAGDLALTLDTDSGFVTATTLAAVSDAFEYNDFGDLTSYSCAFDVTGVYAAAYTRDYLGRVAGKVETRQAEAPETYVYSYDDNGRLENVTKNGLTIHTYGYDLNGNRVAYTGPDSVPVTATYDAQDRMLTYGSTTYTYLADGTLASKTTGVETTIFTYDELGNLIAATLGDGTEITYLIDGRNRRIGKKVNGTLVQGFLYQNSTNPIAELDNTGNIVSLFVYGTKSNVPDYMIRDGQTYRIISDHLGSPLMVVNTATGEVVQEIAYTPFGLPTFVSGDTGFQPFGFAGGLYDTHTGLVRFGARDYDPEAGRFTAKDPLLFEGGTVNLYAYLGNDPLNLIDPSGMGGSADCDDDNGDCNGRNNDSQERDRRWDDNDNNWRASDSSWQIPYWADSLLSFGGALLDAAHYMSPLITAPLSGVGAAMGILGWGIAAESAAQTADSLADSQIREPNRQLREALDNLLPDVERGVRDHSRNPCP